MSRVLRLMVLPLAVMLAACDVQIHDETPAEYPANHQIGMYEIKASTERGSLVSSHALFVSALSNDRTVEMNTDQARQQWRGLIPVRCTSSFPLQFRAVWNVQGMSTRNKLVPAQPREIKLIEPPLTTEVAIDTSEKSRKGWEGPVEYQFVTALNTKITGARIEPLGQDEAGVQAAEPLSVTTELPLFVPCAEPVQIMVHSKAQKAQGYLVIETDHPTVPEWRTRVEFAPAQ